MTKFRRRWLRFLLFVGRRRDVVVYLRYRGLLEKDLETRQKDFGGMLS